MNNKKSAGISFAAAIIAAVLFLVWTALLLTVDLHPSGPCDSVVGLSGLNEYMLGIQKSVPDNIQNIFYNASEMIGTLSLAVMAAFAFFGVVQLVKRKSLKKIDLNLYFLAALYALMLALYVFFEMVVVNCRPILVEGVLEASYPSSHTVLTACVMFSAAFILCGYMKGRALRVIINVSALVLSLVTFAGRFLSCVHWFSDIIGAILLSAALVALFFAACFKYSK